MLAYFNKKSPRPPLKVISIADLDAETFYHEVPKIQELITANPDYAESGLDLRWDDFDRWYRTDEDSYHYSLQAEGDTIGFGFDLAQDKDPLMVGGDGLIEWTEGSTYYYSLTRLQVDGQIEIKGKAIDVPGIGWMDHQWMDAMAEKGWQWFSIQLDDETDIICWNIVNLDGTVESRDLTMMLADGSIYHTTDIELAATDSWKSPDTNETYGTTWTLREPKRGLDLKTNRHPRVNILRPGAGVGGHCISVGPWFLVEAAPGLSPLISTARRVNDGQSLNMSSSLSVGLPDHLQEEMN